MTTERDFADKRWLEPVKDEDRFQLIDPSVAGALIFYALCVALIFERYFR